MRKRLQKLEFEYDGVTYVFDVGIEEVKDFAKFSMNRGGDITNEQLIQMALRRSSDVGVITKKRAEEITEALISSGLQIEDDELTWEELLEWIIGLFIQAINDEAEKYEPAELTIHKDNTATVVVEDKEYDLKFTRRTIVDSISNNELSFNNLLETYVIGTALIKAALKHSKERFGVRTEERIFFSLWAHTLEEDTSHYFEELVDALVFHANEVIESGAKKSQAAIKGRVQ